MTRREDLRKLSEVTDLRLKKLDEIREFLSISPDADDQDVLGVVKWWQKTACGDPSVPAELKTKADRLLCEFQSIDDAKLEILDKLEAFTQARGAIA
jgi:hypothetical protein